jgi:ABC-type multidrug transport system fused ATPase/permease subunit
MPILINYLFRKYQKSLFLTYGLTFLENLFGLLYPLLIGNTINGLLRKNYESFMLLISLWLVHTLIEVMRNIYDTHTFTQIHNHLAIKTILEQSQKGITTSQLATRSALSRDFIDFFEQDIPRVITSVFGLIGSLVMLLFYDQQITFYCLLILLPIVIIQVFVARRSLILNRLLNNSLEQEVEVLTNCEPKKVTGHYHSVGQYRIKLSNTFAINGGIMELLIIGLFVAILLRATSIIHLKIGDMYAIISYAWNYREALDILPILMQQLSRLQDIGARMRFNLIEVI